MQFGSILHTKVTDGDAFLPLALRLLIVRFADTLKCPILQIEKDWLDYGH